MTIANHTFDSGKFVNGINLRASGSNVHTQKETMELSYNADTPTDLKNLHELKPHELLAHLKALTHLLEA